MNTEFSKRIKWEYFEGEKYLLIDFTYLVDFEVYKIIVELEKFLRSTSETDLIVLNDYSHTDFGYSTLATVAKIVIENQSNFKKIAASGLNDEFINYFSKTIDKTKNFAGVFKTKEEAIAFLFSN